MESVSRINITQETAGRETSRSSREEGNVASDPVGQTARDHATHLLTMLRDALGFRFGLKRGKNASPQLEALLFNSMLKKQTERFVFISHTVPLEKVMKWWYGNSLVWILGGEELTPSPLGDKNDYLSSLVIFTGTIRRFLRTIFRRCMREVSSSNSQKSRRSLGIGQTLLQMKKGTPQVSETLINEAMQKHKAALAKSGLKGQNVATRVRASTGGIGLWGDVMQDEDDEKEILKTIDGIINELFPSDAYVTELESASAGFPSFSGYFGSRRANSGQVGELAHVARKLAPDEGSIREIELDRMVTLAMRFPLKQTTSKDSKLQSLFDRVMEHTGSAGIRPPKYMSQRLTALTQKVAMMRPLINEDAFLRETALRMRSKHFDASPVFLQEPLKVRTITKGPSFPYWVLKPFQEFLWKRLKNHSSFQLVGTPLTGMILSKVLGHEIRDDEYFISGDYSAATDNLKQHISRYVINRICNRIGAPNWLRRLASKSLVGHRLHYKDEVLDQVNGQLMGAPLSFPVLCIVNAALVSAPLRRRKEYRRGALSRLPFLVNGDDCGMKYTLGEYRHWMRLASHAGMAPSVGKCYRRRDMIQLNSELYRFEHGSFRYIPYFNFGLCSPSIAKGGSLRHWTSFSSACGEFIRLAGASDKPALRDKLLSIWIRRMAPYIRRVTPFTINWGLPHSVGGLGLPFMESNIHMSETQHRLASTAYHKIAQGINPRIVSPDSDLPPIARAALEELIPFEYVTVSQGEVVSESSLFKSLREGSCMSPFLWLNFHDPLVSLSFETRKTFWDSSHKFMWKYKHAFRDDRDSQLVRLHDLLSVGCLKSHVVAGFDEAFGDILKPVRFYAKLAFILNDAQV